MSRGFVACGFRRVLLAATLLALLPAGARAQDIQQVSLEGQRSILSKPILETSAENADVLVVEYFDYNCPFCKKLAPTLQALISGDRKVAVVYKDWPILGDVSVYAARSALAAQWQGKYLAAHDALMNGPRLAQGQQVDSVLKGAGVNLEVLAQDRTRHAQEITAILVRNNGEAHALGIQGTPGIMVGRLLVPGNAGLSDLQKLVAESRGGK